MRHWIAGTLATAWISTGAIAAPTPRDSDDPATATPVASGPEAPAKSESTPTPADFPPPKDAPAPVTTVSESSSPAPAQPAVRSTPVQPTKPAAVTAPPPSPLPAIASDPATVSAGTTTTGGDGVHWQEPDGRIKGRVYGSAEYFLAWARKGTNPPLVQVISPQNALIAIQTGQLPAGATVDVFGQDGTDPGPFSGVRGTLGLWLDPCSNWGAEIGYSQIVRESDRFFIASTGIPVIGRSFFDVSAQQPSFLRYTNPDGSQRGFIGVDAPTQAVGGELNVRYHGCTIFADRTEYISGIRYFNLRDAISIASGASFFNQAGALTSAFDSSEFFRAKNDFYGGQFGIESHYYFGCWTVDVLGKLALGNVHQDVLIQGSTTVTTPPAAPVTFPNASLLFVQPSNAAQYDRNHFAVMPEFALRLGYQLSSKVRATIGYDVIAITDVVRAGSTIDTNVNPNNTQFIVRGPPSNAPNPVFSFTNSNWWAQGLTAGIAVNY